MKKKTAATLIPAEDIQRQIHVVRGKRVMLDADLARFYGVATFNLNKAVARNRGRFPEDFAFQLTIDETRPLIFQTGMSKPGRGGRRTGAWVFTEQGVAMLASVLRSDRAVTISIAIVRAFVQLRELLATHRALSGKLADGVRKHRDGVVLLSGTARGRRTRMRHVGRPVGRWAEQLERRIEGHDEVIANLFEAMRQLLEAPKPDNDRKIGFNAGP